MNEVETLRSRIIELFPAVFASIDKPVNPNGNWFLDVRFGDKYTSIDWIPTKGFGLCTCSNPNDHGYGQGPDIIVDLDVALQHVIDLLGS